jgi:acyl-CoA synthetase (AMP-forming)/AMP-acid ligase II
VRVPLTTADFLDRAALVYADRLAVADEPDAPDSLGEITYGHLAARARALAAGLDELGVGVGERVAVVSHNSARLLELLYAVPAAGRVLVPINFRLQPHEVTFIVEHSGAQTLLLDLELADSCALTSVAHKLGLGKESDEVLLRFERDPVPWSEPDEDATATINYTSGTTASPKGVQMTHRNLWLNAVTFALHAGVSDRDVYLHTLPTFHANGWGMPFAVAGLGVPQIVLRKVDGAEILRRVEHHGVTLLCGAPTVVAMVLDAAASWDGPIPGRDRTRVVVAGAPPPTRTIERVETELGWEFVQIYGLTETAPLLTVNRRRSEWDALSAGERAERLVRAGVPGIGTRLRVNETGEVLARSNHVLAAYWANPPATEEALEGSEFHTGDGGTIGADGYLTISDRKKDVIITGGENVSSIEVEDRLFRHPAVAEVAVIGVPDEKWGETIKALVVLAPGQTATERELIDFCRADLAHFKCPTTVEFRDAIPRTATGKVQKFKLRETFWAGRDRLVN